MFGVEIVKSVIVRNTVGLVAITKTFITQHDFFVHAAQFDNQLYTLYIHTS